MAELAVEATNLGRSFGTNRALCDLNLQVERGQVVALLGPNGAGKTTTIRILNGVLDPGTGTARVLGMDPHKSGSELRKRSGVLTENFSLYERLTARENLHFYGCLFGVEESRLDARVDELLEMFELAHRAESKVGTFSHGMKQRLAIARALVHNPDILFLDEPTAGLDPEAAVEVDNMIARLSGEENRTVFLATHNLSEAQKLCDLVLVLNEGKTLASGSPAELINSLVQKCELSITLEKAADDNLLQSIRTLSSLSDLKVQDKTLSIVIDRPTSIPELVDSIVNHGGRICSVIPKEPSLEDVYFSLQGRTAAVKGRLKESN